MQEVQHVLVTENELGQRLDNFLIRVLKGVPKSYVYRIIREGRVRINKKRAKPASRLVTGDTVRIPPIRLSEKSGPIKIEESLASFMQQSILYEDDGFIVLNKPAGIAVHGGSGVSFGVIELLRQIRVDLSYLELVHRLDKETSGCLLLAKKKSVLRELQRLFETRSIQKNYWALLYGKWDRPLKCYVDVPLLKNTLASGERVVRVDQEGKSAKTRFVLLANTPSFCLVEAAPKTGRTHQIRVHSAYLGHPIVGDDKYAVKSFKSQEALPVRLYLHARSIQFTFNQQSYKFEAELDVRFLNALNILGIDVGQ